jgi:hydrogenase expression/formation protein HypC
MCVALPGRVVAVIPGPLPRAVVDVGGRELSAQVAVLDELARGDWVLVYAGLVVARASETEARALLGWAEDAAARGAEP